MSSHSGSEEAISLSLTKQEALVLFDQLSRFSNTGAFTFEDQSERRVLWNVCCLLEKVLVEPFMGNYGELLASARASVRDEE